MVYGSSRAPNKNLVHRKENNRALLTDGQLLAPSSHPHAVNGLIGVFTVLRSLLKDTRVKALVHN